MKRGLLIGLAVVAGLVAIALLVFGGTYNSLVQSDHTVGVLCTLCHHSAASDPVEL